MRAKQEPEPIRYEERRRYPIPLPEVWRLLADTDHLNRSIGLPVVEFSPLEGGELVRRARARAYGVVSVRWREFPFDWIRERRYAVRREFEAGPIEWLVGGIELLPHGDETDVVSYAYFKPKNVAGRFLWKLGRAPVHGLLEFCDRYVARRDAGEADPTPVPTRRPRVNRWRLEPLLDDLGRAPVDARLVSQLRDRILVGSDDQLTNIRPYALADAWGIERGEVLQLLLYATRSGLFDLSWQMMCPNCRIPKASVDELGELPPQFHCDTCGILYSVDIDRDVELRFSVSAEVRVTQDAIYCIGGPLRMPHVVAQQHLRPHEDRLVEVTVTEPLQLRAIGGAHRLRLAPGQASRVDDVKLTYAAGRWSGPHSLQSEDLITIPEGATLTLRNQTEGFVLALLESLERTRDATSVADLRELVEFDDLVDPEAVARAASPSVERMQSPQP
jgi:adenylate cyclase